MVGEIIIQSLTMTAARGRGRRLSDVQRLAIIGIIAAYKKRYKYLLMSEILKYLELPSAVKATLAKEVDDTRNGAFGVSHGRPPTLMDAAELTFKAWDAVSAQSIQNCFIKANIGVNYTSNITEVSCVNAVSALVNNVVNEADADIDAWDSVVHSEHQTRGEMITLLMSELELGE